MKNVLIYLDKALLFTGAGALLVLASCAAQDYHGHGGRHLLNEPFDLGAIRSSLGAEDLQKFKCSSPPPPQRKLEFESVYGDLSDNSSIIDPDAYKAYKKGTEKLGKFEAGITTMANRYARSNPPRADIAACTVSWIKTWAENDALLGHATNMGEFVRKWVLASASLSYLQVRDNPSISDHDKTVIEDWLHRVATVVVGDFTQEPGRMSHKNNHLYWAAWGVANAAIATDDVQLFGWAMEKARFGVSEIEGDGTLPLEMKRGRRAFHYHIYAAIPLFMLAHEAERNGIDLYPENNHGLARLAHIIFDNMGDPKYFRDKTGEKQDVSSAATNTSMVWLEPYYADTNDAASVPWLGKFRPMRQSRVGGDATFLYGKH